MSDIMDHSSLIENSHIIPCIVFGDASIGGSKSVLPSLLQLASNKHSATTGYHI
jgi:hypothetical protein